MAGPATTPGYAGRGVALLFPGSNEVIDCLLTEVRTRRHAPKRRPPRPKNRVGREEAELHGCVGALRARR